MTRDAFLLLPSLPLCKLSDLFILFWTFCVVYQGKSSELCWKSTSKMPSRSSWRGERDLSIRCLSIKSVTLQRILFGLKLQCNFYAPHKRSIHQSAAEQFPPQRKNQALVKGSIHYLSSLFQKGDFSLPLFPWTSPTFPLLLEGKTPFEKSQPEKLPGFPSNKIKVLPIPGSSPNSFNKINGYFNDTFRQPHCNSVIDSRYSWSDGTKIGKY